MIKPEENSTGGSVKTDIMSELYFIRHGQASFGAENYDKLSKKGVLQAKILGEHFSEMGIHFDGIYTGTLDRQKKTSKGVSEAYKEKCLFFPEPVIDESFNEYNSEAIWKSQVDKILEENPSFLDNLKENQLQSGLFQKEFQKVFSEVMKRWVSEKHDSKEYILWEEYQNTVLSGIFKIIKEHGSKKRVAVFTSGGPVSVAVQQSLDLSNFKTLDIAWQIINSSVTVFKYNQEGITLSSFNNTAHLELKKDKTLLTYR